MQVLQNEIAREVERTSLKSDDNVTALVKKIRNNDKKYDSFD